MRYGLKFSTIAISKLPKVGKSIADQIQVGLERLAGDPQQYGRPAVCPPFPPFGHQCDIACADESGAKYNCVVFFVYSDCGKFLEIHRMLVQVIRQGSSEGKESHLAPHFRSPEVSAPNE